MSRYDLQAGVALVLLLVASPAGAQLDAEPAVTRGHIQKTVPVSQRIGEIGDGDAQGDASLDRGPAISTRLGANSGADFDTGGGSNSDAAGANPDAGGLNSQSNAGLNSSDAGSYGDSGLNNGGNSDGGFNSGSGGLNRDRKAPRNFTVEVSETSSNSGFRSVLSGSLQMARNNQSFAFKPEERPVARWVRLILHDNYGDDYQGFMGFRGYGEQLTRHAAPTNLTGNYDGASGWGWIHLVQSGNRVTGCYQYQNGTFDGVIDGRVMRLTMRDEGAKPLTGLFQFSPDGQKLVGIVRTDGPADRDFFASYYSAEKTGNRAGGC